jgi:hypothetical protein
MSSPSLLGVRISVALMLVVAGSSVAAGTTIHVPADRATIQAAIDAAADGDVVLVAAGTYVENIDFKGKRSLYKARAARPPPLSMEVARIRWSNSFRKKARARC